MNGSAPKLSLTGSHVEVQRNFQPKVWRETAESTHRCCTSKQVTRMMLSAEAKVTRYVTSSPFFSLAMRDSFSGASFAPIVGGGVVTAEAIGRFLVMQLLDCCEFLVYNRLGKRSVAKGRALLLAYRNAPGEERLQGGPLGLVLHVHRDQHPRKARHGISTRARRVGDGDAEVVRHTLHSAGGSLGHRTQSGLDELARRVLH